ncbi:MAG: A/G-specific adenine glycosylase [Bacteroidota bacterium]|nr:A/G-specific adenine glycosylase [Bacteroidota bacterium]
MEGLLSWNRNTNKRTMPWKGEKNPYKIWISEIILQQTRVQQGLAYYHKFIHSFPDVKTLAEAPEQKILKHWEGLGYYTRCRNLIATAKYIHTELHGKFPAKYEDLLDLKGIGTYTASAIASFAFNLPYAVLDGNVFRILSRFFGIATPLDTAGGKKIFSKLAKELLDKKNPAEYNQAIMDFGATVCKPSQPLCEKCPFQLKCIAFKKGIINSLPVKKKRVKQRQRFFTYLIIEHAGSFYIHKRTAKDIWQGLYEFILIESSRMLPMDQLQKTEEFLAIISGNEFRVTGSSKAFIQKISHQIITGKFFHIHTKYPLVNGKQYRLTSKSKLNLLPFPKFIASYLKD